MGWGCSEPKVPSLGGERGCAFGITWCLREERDGEGVSKMAGEGPGVIRAGSFPEEGDEGRAMTSDPPASHCPSPGFSSWVSAVRSSGGDSLLQIPSWGKGNPLSWLLQAAALASVLVNTRGLTELSQEGWVPVFPGHKAGHGCRASGSRSQAATAPSRCCSPGVGVLWSVPTPTPELSTPSLSASVPAYQMGQ